MYCLVSTPTGPKPLSAERMVMFLLCFMSRRIACCWGVRFGGVVVDLNVVLIFWMNEQMRLSISLGGKGGRHEDLIRRALGSYSSSWSPEKKIFKLKSRSKRVVVRSRSSCVMLMLGVGINFNPKPSSWEAKGGSLCSVVRS